MQLFERRTCIKAIGRNRMSTNATTKKQAEMDELENLSLEGYITIALVTTIRKIEYIFFFEFMMRIIRMLTKILSLLLFKSIFY